MKAMRLFAFPVDEVSRLLKCEKFVTGAIFAIPNSRRVQTNLHLYTPYDMAKNISIVPESPDTVVLRDRVFPLTTSSGIYALREFYLKIIGSHPRVVSPDAIIYEDVSLAHKFPLTRHFYL